MSPTLDKLQSITRSEAFNALPQEAAQAALDAGQEWWVAMDRAQERAAQLLVWDIGQHMAVLLETYGPTIWGVELIMQACDAGEDRPYIDTTLVVNGETCHEEACPLPEDDKDAMDAVDGGAVLKAVVARLCDIPAQLVFSHLDVLRRAFGEEVSSANQARAIIQKHAPRIEPLLREHGLQAALPAGKPGRGRGRARM